MTLKTLFNKSVYGTIGYIKSIEDVDLLERYILYNLPVLQEFKQIIVATNYKSYPEFVTENSNLWKKYFPDCVLLDSKINRGHQIGTADLDNMLVDYCKANNIDWLCKSANDVIVTPYVLSKEVDDADFYFMMGIGVAGMRRYNFDIDTTLYSEFVPQTNFYIIDISKIDKLNTEDDIKMGSCEYMLKWCIERNNLSKFHLVPEFKYRKLIDLVLNIPIHDPSHKNIMIEGICHYHFPDQEIFEL
jgi:hypothetical protein